MSGVAIEEWDVFLMDLTEVAKNDNLGKEILSVIGWVILEV